MSIAASLSSLFGRRRGRRSDSWSRIGGYDYTSTDMERVPGWVRKAMRNMDLRSIASTNRYYELTGQRYNYRVTSAGQGAPIVNVYRRRRGRQ